MMLVALSDGHGMETEGKRTPPIPELAGRIIKENEFNREVVKEIAIQLKINGIDVLLVAPTDLNTPLAERIQLANSKKADVYVSVHYNAFDGKFDNYDPEGLSVHIYPGSIKGRKLAENVIEFLKQGTPQKNRGIVENNFLELRQTMMPAILTENGFMDNKREAILMADTNFIKEVATEHTKGICKYFGIPYKATEVLKPVFDATVLFSKSIIPIHSLNKTSCASYNNVISGTFQYKNVTSSMFCAWSKWKRKSSTHDWLKQPETVLYINRKGEVKSQRCLYWSEIKDDVVHAIGGLGLHDYNPNLEGFKGAYADVLRNTYHTAIGHDGNQWIGVYAKGTGSQIKELMINKLGCKIAIMLDGGHIAAVNTKTFKANTSQLQNNMIQFI